MEINKLQDSAVQHIVDQQVSKWERETKRRYKKPIRPVITICRLPGSGTEILAKKLSEDLKLDLFDREIVEEIAKSTGMSKCVIESLDEQDRGTLDNWLGALQKKVHLRPDEYLMHLTHVVASIGAHGHAVIVGRGAGFILPSDVCLRLLLVAPKDVRVNNVKEAYQLTSEEAERRVMETERDRKAFIKEYFEADLTDPTNYDLTINTTHFNVDVAVAIIKEAFNTRKWYKYSITT
ncbi:MAG: cytidylate kinase-like family protein [Deltaproteobacteria bacterium]|nr:cytidylate kinase-like family protein [Deltaproteobacteria bacterium]